MSLISPTAAVTAAQLGSTGVAPISDGDLPASVRNGSPAAKQAYAEGLAFEQVLVNELAQQLTATVSGNDSDSDSDGSSTDATADGDNDGTSDATTGLLGSDPAGSLYASLIPQALSDSIMSSGGLGIASEIAGALDPTLEGKS
ncbi:MAG: hypothetical protein ACLP8S_22760 [Solirubrobacteraceae bacterium]